MSSGRYDLLAISDALVDLIVNVTESDLNVLRLTKDNSRD